MMVMPIRVRKQPEAVSSDSVQAIPAVDEMPDEKSDEKTDEKGK
jgi:hypothetical protein